MDSASCSCMTWVIPRHVVSRAVLEGLRIVTCGFIGRLTEVPYSFDYYYP